jgi:hypothetical protein
LIGLSINEIRRPINTLILHSPAAPRTACTGQTGDHDTERKRAESTTPADTTPTFNHDHAWLLPY